MREATAGRSRKRAVLLLLAAVLIASCSSGDQGGQPKSGRNWGLALDVDGAEYTVPSELMNVYLVEDENYPETFLIEGENLLLVGEFPLEVHVGYEEEWARLFGKPVTIRSSYDFRDGVRESYIRLPERTRYRVLDGSFAAGKLTGTYAGLEGDLTLHGTITLRVETPSGEKTLTGTFAFHCVSWG